MGDLASESKELECINLFCSSIYGKINENENIHCFRTLNYKAYFFNKFNVINEEGGRESSNEVCPDMVLWNSLNQIVLLIEIKGENSIEESHLNQLYKYKKISIEEVQNRLRNIVDNPSITIKNIFTGIVYQNQTISKCKRSKQCQELLKTFFEDHIVLYQSIGQKLKILNPDFISFDDNLKDVLINGIELPFNPPRYIYLSSNPCLKGVIYAIFNYLHDSFYNNEEINEISLNPLDLKRDVFFYSNVSIKRLTKGLENLLRLGVCSRIDRNYIFKFSEIQNFEEVKNKIINIDCLQQKPIQRDLIEYFQNQRY